jgi:hypothetical protein
MMFGRVSTAAACGSLAAAQAAQSAINPRIKVSCFMFACLIGLVT